MFEGGRSSDWSCLVVSSQRKVIFEIEFLKVQGLFERPSYFIYLKTTVGSVL